MKNARRIAFIEILAMLGDLRTEEPRPGGCVICGKHEKNSTGECEHCGTYKCAGCSKYHLGDATKPCPGMGVEIPERA